MGSYMSFEEREDRFQAKYLSREYHKTVEDEIEQSRKLLVEVRRFLTDHETRMTLHVARRKVTTN